MIVLFKKKWKELCFCWHMADLLTDWRWEHYSCVADIDWERCEFIFQTSAPILMDAYLIVRGWKKVGAVWSR